MCPGLPHLKQIGGELEDDEVDGLVNGGTGFDGVGFLVSTRGLFDG